MSLRELLTRDKRVTITDTGSGTSATYVIADNQLNGTYGSGGGGLWALGMSIPAAWRASTLIADLIGGLPWAAYADRPGRPTEKLEPTPELLETPHPPFTRVTTVAAWVLDLLWHGNSIGVVADRDANGVPTAAAGVPATSVEVRRSPDNGRLQYRIGRSVYDQDDVLHVRGHCLPGDLRGKGVLEVHCESLALAREQRKQAGGLATSGVPSGIITSADPKLDEAGAADLKSRWLTAQATRQPMVLTPQTTWQAVAWDAEELQLVEARKMSNADMALLFGMPSSLLNLDGPSRTYTNTTQENQQLLRFGLGGHLTRFEQGLSALFPRGVYVRATLDALLRPDTTARYAAHQVAIAAGFLTVDEVRALEDRPPLPPPAVPPRAIPPPAPADPEED